MITIFDVFRQFSAQQMAFLLKTKLWSLFCTRQQYFEKQNSRLCRFFRSFQTAFQNFHVVGFSLRYLRVFGALMACINRSMSTFLVKQFRKNKLFAQYQGVVLVDICIRKLQFLVNIYSRKLQLSMTADTASWEQCNRNLCVKTGILECCISSAKLGRSQLVLPSLPRAPHGNN
jgi:hypothetical protein